jgi:hypothetical protein
MSRDFRSKAYIKEGCPFSFKFLVFMVEADLLDEIEIVRVREGDADYEATKSKLSEHLGKARSRPSSSSPASIWRTPTVSSSTTRSARP